MITEKTKQAALDYHANRTSKGVDWDKETDQNHLFECMSKDGLTGIHAMAGTHVGEKDGQYVIIDIGDEVSSKTFPKENGGDNFIKQLVSKEGWEIVRPIVL